MVLKAERIRMNFIVRYITSDLERGLEEILEQNGASLSDPEYRNGNGEGDYIGILRKTKINKVEIDYWRILDFHEALNLGQTKSKHTREIIELDTNNYVFGLDPNERYMRISNDYGDIAKTTSSTFSVNEIAPGYKGILTNERFRKKDGDYKNLKITRERFLKEIDSILKEYVFNKGMEKK